METFSDSFSDVQRFISLDHPWKIGSNTNAQTYAEIVGSAYSYKLRIYYYIYSSGYHINGVDLNKSGTKSEHVVFYS